MKLNMQTATQDEKIFKKFPFLRDFPFKDVSIKANSYETQEKEVGYTTFVHFGDSDKQISVILFDEELEWMMGLANNITDLDTINQVIHNGFESTDILEKRDAMLATIEWLIKVTDGKASLNFKVFSEVLAGLMEHFGVKDINQFILSLNKITNKEGVVILSPEEYEALMSFYYFHLVYTKVILGIIIASKVSV